MCMHLGMCRCVNVFGGVGKMCVFGEGEWVQCSV